jgi:hypothetical protein
MKLTAGATLRVGQTMKDSDRKLWRWSAMITQPAPIDVAVTEQAILDGTALRTGRETAKQTPCQDAGVDDYRGHQQKQLGCPRTRKLGLAPRQPAWVHSRPRFISGVV